MCWLPIPCTPGSGKADGQLLQDLLVATEWDSWCQTLLHFGQAMAWAEDSWVAAHSVCFMCHSFAALRLCCDLTTGFSHNECQLEACLMLPWQMTNFHLCKLSLLMIFGNITKICCSATVSNNTMLWLNGITVYKSLRWRCLEALNTWRPNAFNFIFTFSVSSLRNLCPSSWSHLVLSCRGRVG